MAERDRLTVLRGHFEQNTAPSQNDLAFQVTASALPQNDSTVAVALPERLSENNWAVRRYVHRLCTFVTVFRRGSMTKDFLLPGLSFRHND